LYSIARLPELGTVVGGAGTGAGGPADAGGLAGAAGLAATLFDGGENAAIAGCDLSDARFCPQHPTLYTSFWNRFENDGLGAAPIEQAHGSGQREPGRHDLPPVASDVKARRRRDPDA